MNLHSNTARVHVQIHVCVGGTCGVIFREYQGSYSMRPTNHSFSFGDAESQAGYPIVHRHVGLWLLCVPVSRLAHHAFAIHSQRSSSAEATCVRTHRGQPFQSHRRTQQRSAQPIEGRPSRSRRTCFLEFRWRLQLTARQEVE